MHNQVSAGLLGRRSSTREKAWLASGHLHVPVIALVVVSTVSSGQGGARTWHVPEDALTIQAGISLASPGDDVLVGPGLYWEHNIVMKGGVLVHSEQGASATTVDAAGVGVGFDFPELREVATLEGMTIRNGYAQGHDEWEGSGGGIRSHDSYVVIRDCAIVDCTAEYVGGGISVFNSVAVIERCTVRGCAAMAVGGIGAFFWSNITVSDCDILDNHAASSAAGIYAAGPKIELVRCKVSGNYTTWQEGGGIGCQSPALTIRDCLIVDNAAGEIGWAAGVFVNASMGSISGCTVARNRGWTGTPTLLVMDSPGLAIDNVLIAFNEGAACYNQGSRVDFSCSDVYGNMEGNGLCGNDLGGNFSADPLFCDAANGDYTLDWASPCLPGNHPDGVDCGLIGARDAGCGTLPTGACCFADGSCLVLGQSACGEQGGSYMGNGTTCDPNECEPTPVQQTTWGRIKAGYR